MTWDYVAPLTCPAFHPQTMAAREDERREKALWAGRHRLPGLLLAQAGLSLDRFAFS